MKLLTLRFQNLNSLEGEWQIDFSHPDYEQNGIFAIAGPTGAGKTTILDAICLALYGKTPRLDLISQSQNEIMSRQHGSCFAELTFQTANGTYSAHWSQRRARDKADGRLQPPKRELFDLTTNKLISSRIAEVTQHITDITGLDFERFTRTMLLAQGRFADFLQASEEKRSPILEQITGTAIYSDISMKVHEIKSQEEKKLGELQASIEGFQLLSDEELKQLESELSQLQAQLQQITSRQSELSTIIKWWEDSAHAQTMKQQLHAASATLTQEENNFAPAAQRLALANKTLPLISLYSELKTYRQQQQEDDTRLHTLRPQLASYQEEDAAAQTALAEASQQKQRHAAHLDEQRQLFNQVRELDAAIKQRRHSLDEEMARVNRSRQRLEAHQTTLQQAITAESEELVKVDTLLRRFIEQGYSIGDNAQHDLTALLDNKNSHQLLMLFSDQNEIEPLTQRLEEHKALLRDLETIESDILSYYKDNQALIREQRRAEQLQAQIKQYEERLQHLAQVLLTYQARLAQREAEHQLALTWKSLEEHRHALVDGEPCPLCGALEHPLKSDVPTLDSAQNQLEQAKNSVKQAERMIHEIERDMASAKTDLNKTQAGIKKDLDQLQGLSDKIRQRNPILNERLELDSLTTAGAQSTDAAATQARLAHSIQELGGQLQYQLKSIDKELSIRTKSQQWSHATRLQLQQHRSAIQQSEQQIKDAQELLSSSELASVELQRTLDGLIAERQALFADRDVSSEEQALTKQLQTLEAELEQKTQLKDKTVSALTRLQQQITSLEERLKDNSQRLEQQTTQLNSGLMKQGFTDEEDFNKACMPEEERLDLETQQRQLTERKSTLKSQQQQCEETLQRLATQFDEAPQALADSQAELQQLEQSKAELNANRGRAQERLQNHYNTAERLKEQQQLIQAQEKETQRWRQLHKLIGSSDGKKYRNFAQSLTFELVLHYANRQLVHMSDRYALRLDTQPPHSMSLAVQDNYQGGELRSVKNLSGGESFIVSLALALGLSSMVSGKMQLQSLFLDEGFGTLDEDSLDIALSALASLQQSGKIIGIISHVGALKERISTQIQVIPISSGRSRLEGPGISQLNGK